MRSLRQQEPVEADIIRQSSPFEAGKGEDAVNPAEGSFSGRSASLRAGIGDGKARLSRAGARLLGKISTATPLLGYSSVQRAELSRRKAGTMRLTSFGKAGLALSLCLFSVSVPRLLAQTGSQQQGWGQGRGGGGGMFMMGGNSAHGTVTAVSGNDITIKDEQGQIYKVETGPNTRIRKDRGEVNISDIHPGDVIVAVGNLDEQAKTVGAMFVVVLNPQQAARMEQMRSDFGKTWVAGQVTAKQGLTLTVERPDKVTQIITVDENTEFRKRGPQGQEDVAFPDIKVGDHIMARGSLQNGNFLATTVGVVPPRPAGGQRFRGQQPGRGATPPPPASASPQN